jgi:lysyl-tRNA synthetase class 2
MLELYWAYVGYEEMMRLSEELLSTLATEILGEAACTWQGARMDFTPPWPRYTMREAVEKLAGVPAESLETEEGLRRELEVRDLPIPPGGTYGHLLAGLFEETVEDQLTGPVFITHHPVEVSPLAKQCPEDPRFTERFELYLGGMEIANGFSELNDPQVQAERFQQQIAAREKGDDEAHLFDRDYIRALEHGMPPAGGQGIGIDRLTMIFTDRPSIRDVILFPLMRPEARAED